MTLAVPKLLAISSGGGHWVQLLRLRPAFVGCRVLYATVANEYRSDVVGEQFQMIPDANRWRKFALLRSAVAVLIVILRFNPDVVVTTGAAPGYLGALIGKMLGSRVIWVDSAANVEKISLSGRLAALFVDLCLTQWQHLERPNGPLYYGSVI